MSTQGVSAWGCTPPPCGQISWHTCLWKHYLSATSVADGKKCWPVSYQLMTKQILSIPIQPKKSTEYGLASCFTDSTFDNRTVTAASRRFIVIQNVWVMVPSMRLQTRKPFSRNPTFRLPIDVWAISLHHMGTPTTWATPTILGHPLPHGDPLHYMGTLLPLAHPLCEQNDRQTWLKTLSSRKLRNYGCGRYKLIHTSMTMFSKSIGSLVYSQ